MTNNLFVCCGFPAFAFFSNQDVSSFSRVTRYTSLLSYILLTKRKIKSGKANS